MQESQEILNQQLVEINYNLFDKIEPPLGEGEYGKVYKVECLFTSKLCEQDPNKRIII